MATPVVLLATLFLLGGAAAAGGGKWESITTNTGVSAMHMQLLPGDRLVFFDRTDFGPSGLLLPAGRCRDDPADTALPHDCTAHAAELHLPSGELRALTLRTDSWCSSGALSPDGSLVQTGGYNDGDRAVRRLRPCAACDWEEDPTGLLVRRWYATTQSLPDGGAAVVGGRGQFSYELFPSRKLFPLPFLRQTRDSEENNLYPFVHLNVDGNLFVFANGASILLNHRNGQVLREYPAMPGGAARTYPGTGSSVLLPLGGAAAEVMVCGGAPRGAYAMAQRGQFMEAVGSCGRLRIAEERPAWAMEEMPAGRVMGDMILLPNGEVLIINGGGRGSAGWELGREPVLAPVVYDPAAPPGARFKTQSAAATPRMYHSTAVLLRDGRVMVGGSNPHKFYNFTGVLFPTDTSLEAFSPEYMAAVRPEILPPFPAKLGYGQRFVVYFAAAGRIAGGVRVTLAAPSFTTHSLAMNQRLLVLETAAPGGGAAGRYGVRAVAPPSPNLAPPGFYMLFVVCDKVPSVGAWVQIN